ncbi:DUF86 domain-containing protein [Sporosarcina sp. HYO08]|uniref:DUF86 domain-containing protein n=1 Tax=Sporosarcina sp. HYO08 TaxID=1759557 RepID=UPI00079B6B13|nr:DUF86 domain-containing protein [Sporosarcina sp. HYO08]KXH79229.1 hypothetical protein AU377_11610 [Sporosarcina sp. HYO08]
MYFIDRTKMYRTLDYMEKLLQQFETKQNWHEDFISTLALERIAHVVIESVIDVGNSMIDGFIMRDPGSYDDIIDIMEDERVITAEMSVPLKNVLALRKMIVREFTEVEGQEVEAVLRASMEELAVFPSKVRYYLENELGPVSAFLPEEK